MERDYVRLVLSDTHIGSVNSKEEDLHNFLNSIEFDELILAGDIIDFIKVPTFTEYSALLFEFVINLKKPVIYIIGNHDFGFREFAGKTVGNVTFMETYDFEYGGRKHRIQHGDQYEKGIVHWRTAMNIISIFQDVIERWLKFNLAGWWINLFKKKRQLKRIWDIIKHWNDDADVFIMGHTHTPEALIWVDKEENIKTYVNTGDWIQNSTYVIIKDNMVRLKRYVQEKNT